MIIDSQQTEHWKGVGQKKIVGMNPHKRKCPWMKQRGMEDWPQVDAIQKSFPWSADVPRPYEVAIIPNQIEALLGLKGSNAAKGYWREPSCDGAVHDADLPERTLVGGYICHGSVLLQPTLPSHTELWALPATQIPHLEFDADPELKFRIPQLYDTDFVKDWASWYEWRKLPRESAVALRMDMVLTVYHLLTKVLDVVGTSKEVSKSRRKLNIHFVGAEKELNIIPFELALLIPNTDTSMSFFGQACKKLCDIAAEKYPGSLATKSTVFEYTAPASLGGTENAGLFAYITWQILYRHAASEAIPWAVTEYHRAEVLEYQEHMIQWRDLGLYGSRIELQKGLRPREEVEKNMANIMRAQARGADLNPFMRPGLMEADGLVPRAYNGFVLRVV
ncbi:hypothetical protein C8F04DRAFT_1294104 [Mycena alexandri]|uniref:Mitochondrial splicing suppressor 51-like C-terminal domain-containing protein n=1 Tax=Mycena alexandri TaxID=1745969 RepID=A0AAD6SHB5_9AGAR|nr:hypothetical protein C8F04DRAFT_1294104 [Mycena alexandri]